MLRAFTSIPALYLLLLIPTPESEFPDGAGETPFAWHQDSLWDQFEEQFAAVRQVGCAPLDSTIVAYLHAATLLLDTVEAAWPVPDNPMLRRLETALFRAAVPVAACPERQAGFDSLVMRVRRDIKRLTAEWDMTTAVAQETTYRLLYGSRAALEESLLQTLADSLNALLTVAEEPSVTPSAIIMGVTLHSGDMLVSRGGAPTSALIARGSDFPGNFSHIALAHVDSQGVVTIIESHIECGAKLATVEEYLRDTKLRIMVLRLRHDLPTLAGDPMLPHRVATAAREEVRERHVPYDFAMDWKQPEAKFCSEVVYSPYRDAGIELWAKRSRMSGRGVVNWLAVFGVEHFVTLAPSDLEYDPSVQVIAEWRDPQILFKDHVDNAVIDAMLERADSGDVLTYGWWLLPVGRVLKAYSWVLNRFGAVGPVPEGMPAEAALRNERFSERHRIAVARTISLAEQFRAARGYRPPYWELVRLARQALTLTP